VYHEDVKVKTRDFGKKEKMHNDRFREAEEILEF